MDAAAYFEQLRLGGGRRSIAESGHCLRVRNDSGADRALGEILQVGDAIVDDFDQNQRALWFSGDAVTYPTRVIGSLVKPLKDGEIGPLKVDGVALAMVNLTSITHFRCGPSYSGYELESNASGGPWDIVWHPSVTGSQLCVVSFGIRGSWVVAKAPSGGIAAMSGSTPGSASCVLYRLVSGSLTAVVDDDGITTVSETMYNISASAVAADAWIQFKADADGTCFVDYEDCG